MDRNIHPIKRDESIARKNAIASLLDAKKEERKNKMYHWRRGSLVVSRNSEERLRETVKELGYEWSEGRVGD